MIITYYLALLLSSDPYPVFAFIKGYDSQSECDEAMKKMDSMHPETKTKTGCIALAQESV